jgi:NAD(P)H-flavin reductase
MQRRVEDTVQAFACGKKAKMKIVRKGNQRKRKPRQMTNTTMQCKCGRDDHRRITFFRNARGGGFHRWKWPKIMSRE